MKSFAEIIAAARKKGPKRLAIAGPPNDELHEALAQAVADGIAAPLAFDDAPAAVATAQLGNPELLVIHA